MNAGLSQFIADSLVDIISEQNISPKQEEIQQGFKKGFFAQKPYIQSKTTLKGARPLVTERFILDKIKKGETLIKLGYNSIITPSARLLIEEGKVKIVE